MMFLNLLVAAMVNFNPFPSKQYPENAWQALFLVAKGHRKQAEDAAERFRLDIPMDHTPSWQADTFDALIDRIFIDRCCRDPGILASTSLLEGLGITEHNQWLPDESLMGKEAKIEAAQHFLRSLKAFPFEDLTETQKATYLWVHEWLTLSILKGEMAPLDFRLEQVWGALKSLIQSCDEFHPLNNPQDFENYLKKMHGISCWVDDVIEADANAVESGYSLPKFIRERVYLIAAPLARESVENHLFVNIVKKKIVLDQQQNGRLQKVIEGEVKPAFLKLVAYLNGRIDDPQTPIEGGLFRYPHGQEFYRLKLREMATDTFTPEQIHALGHQLVSEITSEIRRNFIELGKNDPLKSTGELIQELRTCKEYYFSNDDEGRADCLKFIHRLIENAVETFYSDFKTVQKAAVEVVKVPDVLASTMPAAFYMPPSIDGSRRGRFFINLSDMSALTTYRLPTLTIHEAIPGHHLQCSLQLESNLPLLRKTMNHCAYAEGWALYMETLAYEKGFFDNPETRIGYFQDQLLRAVRLVVDTGIHALGWSREKALDYMVETMGDKRSSLEVELDRYFVLPGQAVSYMLGKIKIMQLRERAKECLKDQFDLAEFHDVILQAAGVPLDILDQCVEEWLLKSNRISS